jgi:hypothetical protein
VDSINRRLDQAMDNVELDIPWKTRVLLVGGLIGAGIGIASAYFYVRAAEESGAEGETPPMPEAGDAVRLGLSLLNIVRTITEWGRSA